MIFVFGCYLLGWNFKNIFAFASLMSFFSIQWQRTDRHSDNNINVCPNSEQILQFMREFRVGELES